MIKARLTGLATAAAMLVCAAPASAGLKYAQSPDTLSPAGDQEAASVECPAGSKTIGGGVSSDAGFLGTSTVASYPFYATYWIEVTNVYSGNQYHRAFGICDTGSRSMRYQSKVITKGEDKKVKAACPSGKNAYGGGFQHNAAYEANTIAASSSRPYDDGDSNSRRDDGWEAEFHNYSAANSAYVYAFVVCGPAGTTVKTDTENAGPTSQALVDKGCGSKKVTGGGARISGVSGNGGWITSTYPFDGDDGDTKRDDGWAAEIDNNMPDQKTITAYAICR